MYIYIYVNNKHMIIINICVVVYYAIAGRPRRRLPRAAPAQRRLAALRAGSREAHY